MEESVNNATPTAERCVTSYPARRAYTPGPVYPPQVPGVHRAIDIHCHAHLGQQDALALAKLASENGMGGILYKTIGTFAARSGPMQEFRRMREDLERWAEDRRIEPVKVWAGYGVSRDNQNPTAEKLRAQLAQGVAAIWLPVANHANTYHKVGGRLRAWDKSADPKAHSDPLPWAEALARGFYMLDGQARLTPEYEETVRIVADHGAALFFGHATHDEIFALAELIDKLGFKRAVIDHPFSPFIDLSIAQMKALARTGIYLNFTYDELSPLLGIDPKKMYEAIRAVGVEHFTLSSDAGEPLFPHSVECMRLIRGYMEAFGMKEAELDLMCVANPARILGA